MNCQPVKKFSMDSSFVLQDVVSVVAVVVCVIAFVVAVFAVVTAVGNMEIPLYPVNP